MKKRRKGKGSGSLDVCNLFVVGYVVVGELGLGKTENVRRGWNVCELQFLCWIAGDGRTALDPGKFGGKRNCCVVGMGFQPFPRELLFLSSLIEFGDHFGGSCQISFWFPGVFVITIAFPMN